MGESLSRLINFAAANAPRLALLGDINKSCFAVFVCFCNACVFVDFILLALQLQCPLRPGYY